MLCILTTVSFLSHIAFGAAPGDGPSLSQPLTVAWRYETSQTTDLTPATDEHSIYVPLGGGVLVGWNAAEGKPRWKAKVGGDFSASPAVDDRAVYSATRYTSEQEKQTH